MEWVFVFLPPILALFISVFGGLFLAFFVPLPGTNLWGRWAIAVGIILGVPLGVHLVRARLRR
jgi:hypothetical protein